MTVIVSPVIAALAAGLGGPGPDLEGVLRVGLRRERRPDVDVVDGVADGAADGLAVGPI